MLDKILRMDSCLTRAEVRLKCELPRQRTFQNFPVNIQLHDQAISLFPLLFYELHEANDTILQVYVPKIPAERLENSAQENLRRSLADFHPILDNDGSRSPCIDLAQPRFIYLFHYF